MAPRIHKSLEKLSQVLLALFLVAACSKEKESTQNTKKDKLDHFSDPNLKSREFADVLKITSIGKPLENLPFNADLIEVISDELKTFDHPELHKQATREELATALKGVSPLSLRDELGDPHSRWNEDPALKRAVIGRLALLTGVIGGAGKSYLRIPELFLARASQNQPIAEDALTLRIVDLASTIAEQKIAVSSEDFKVWEDLACAPNVCHRRIALLLFGSLRPTSEQAEQFFSKFLAESDPYIAESFITKVVASSALVDSKSILTKFKDAPGARPVMVFLEAEIEALTRK